MAIPFALLDTQLRLTVGHGTQQALLLDEGYQHHGLPVVLLAIQITFEFRGVKLSQRTIRLQHQVMICHRQEIDAGRWQHGKQL